MFLESLDMQTCPVGDYTLPILGADSSHLTCSLILLPSRGRIIPDSLLEFSLDMTGDVRIVIVVGC